MKVGLLTNVISPHQLPLARMISDLVGAENYRYVYTERLQDERVKMGWSDEAAKLDFQVICYDEESRKWLEAADLVYCEERNFDLLETRIKAGKKTFYVSERWLKPIHGLPGWLRFLQPSYFMMARRFIKLFDSPSFKYLAQGELAQRDMSWICRVLGHKLPKGEIIPWGYFVAPTSVKRQAGRQVFGNRPLRILWVGRMIRWKRVDVIIKAVKSLSQDRFSLVLVGNGDRRASLERLADGATNILFRDSLPIDEIRREMRLNDVYVLASNGEEGWGAALNEAMEEGMLALGTYEAGASSYLLPESHKFHAGDWKRLADLLKLAAEGLLVPVPIGEWSAEKAAQKILELAQ